MTVVFNKQQLTINITYSTHQIVQVDRFNQTSNYAVYLVCQSDQVHGREVISFPTEPSNQSN